MELLCSLNSLTYVNDYQALGVGLIVGNDEISSRHALSISFETMKNLSQSFKVFVLMNQLYDQKDLELVKQWLSDIKNSQIYGIIFQDFGLLNMAKEMGLKQEMMYMPETLNTNGATLNDFKAMGIDSSFLAREISLEDVVKIAQKTEMPLMVQIHGVMYMAQSRRQLLSNYARENGLDLAEDIYTLKVKDNDLEAWIFEDRFGTNIVFKSELVALDYLGSLDLEMIRYGFVDCFKMDAYRALEVVNLYQEAIHAVGNGTFTKHHQALRGMLESLMGDVEKTDGFYQDRTVYKLDDVRVMDDEKRNQSNH